MYFTRVFAVYFLVEVSVCGSSFPNPLELVPNALKFTLGSVGVTVGSTLQSDPSLSVNIFDPDYNRSISELITSMGYPVEEYEVTTEDGYILTVYRIPYGKGNRYQLFKNPVLIVHGTAGNGWDYVMNYYPYQNLGCILADAGYDVYLANLRGNLYSQKHVSLSTMNPEYWKFSIDELGLYDVPAMIDFILRKTASLKLTYIGHSLGTTSIFALLSTRTEYNDKISLVCCMSPVAKMEHATSPIIQLYQLTGLIAKLTAITGVKGMIPATALQPSVRSRVICGVSILSLLCRLPDELGGGIDSGRLNKTRLSVYSHHSNSGTSAYVLDHYGQLKGRNEFGRYDYGTEENQERYGQDTPPIYDISRITANIALYSSRTDALADQEDIDYLRQSIPNIVIDLIVEPDYAHIDFLWAIDAYKNVYNPMLQDINKYSK